MSSIKNLIIISNTSDNPFAIDIAHFCSQLTDMSDVIALKNFQNTEFCPRFLIGMEEDSNTSGYSLKGKSIAILSTTSSIISRNALAMRNMIIARAAKDNAAKEVILIEPDLFYSCQDRGPQEKHSLVKSPNENLKRKKFNGQPFTAALYAELLSISGVDKVLTVHNHSISTRKIFNEKFTNQVYNYIPTDLFASYLCDSGIIDKEKIILCAPDEGAMGLVKAVKEEMENFNVKTSLLNMKKDRFGERTIEMEPSETSDISIKDIEGRDVIVFDDMVRTGTTITKCCRLLREYKPRRIIFCVTHFHSSSEIRENLNDNCIDEIVTTNTVPSILNRDSQGRLRKKIVVLKIEKWVAKKLYDILDFSTNKFENKDLFYADISSKNPRSITFRGKF